MDPSLELRLKLIFKMFMDEIWIVGGLHGILSRAKYPVRTRLTGQVGLVEITIIMGGRDLDGEERHYTVHFGLKENGQTRQSLWRLTGRSDGQWAVEVVDAMIFVTHPTVLKEMIQSVVRHWPRSLDARCAVLKVTPGRSSRPSSP